MLVFRNVRSCAKPDQFSTDKLHVKVLLDCTEKDETQTTTDKDGNPVEVTTTWYTYSYNQYTKQEWQELINSTRKDEIVNELDQSLEAVQANKIQETKEKLVAYYKENPLFSKVHKAEGEYYAITAEKQTYLSHMLDLCTQAEALGIEFTPTWNATGESCEPWTKAELQQLSLQIASKVYPAVSKQQAYEKSIKDMTNVSDIQSLVIYYTEKPPVVDPESNPTKPDTGEVEDTRQVINGVIITDDMPKEMIERLKDDESSAKADEDLYANSTEEPTQTETPKTEESTGDVSES